MPTAEVLTAEAVVEYLEDLTERADPEDGFPVLHWARRFAAFRRVEVPLAWFSPAVAQEPVSASCVALYAGEDPATAPPIVVDTVDRTIMDGYHRFNAALRRGDATIVAYVGERPRADWVPWEDLPAELQADPSSLRFLPAEAKASVVPGPSSFKPRR